MPTIVLFALSLLAPSAPAPAVSPAADAVEQGRIAYTANRCSLCHSVGGKGNPKGPLDGVGSRLTTDEIRRWLLDPEAMAKKAGATRKPAMVPYRELPKPEIEALVAYLSTLKKEP